MAFMCYVWTIIIKVSCSLASQKELWIRSVPEQCIQYEMINLQHCLLTFLPSMLLMMTKCSPLRDYLRRLFIDLTKIGPKNPKIRALLDEIINDTPPEKSPSSTISQANPQNAPVLQKKVPKPPPEIIVAEVFPFESPEKVLRKPLPKVIAAVFQEKEQPEELVVESTPPRTKGDIIGFSDTEVMMNPPMMNPSMLRIYSQT